MLNEKKIEYMSNIHTYRYLKQQLEMRNNLDLYQGNSFLFDDDEIINFQMNRLEITYADVIEFEAKHKDKVREIAVIEPKRTELMVQNAIVDLTLVGALKITNKNTLSNDMIDRLNKLWTGEFLDITEDMTEKEFNEFIKEVKQAPNGVWEVAKLYEIKKGMK